MIDWPQVQARLGVSADGVPGPATYTALLRAMGANTLAPALAAACAAHLPANDIADSGLSLAHWLGQNAHESEGFRRLEENLNYSPERMMGVWPSRFPTLAAAAPFAGKPALLAERVYGGRMGNRMPGDGWKFRGRGVKMITGRDNYAWMQDLTGIVLLPNPEAAAEPETAVRLSALFWARRGCQALAMADDIRSLTARINGGLTNIEDRRKRTVHAKRLLGLTA